MPENETGRSQAKIENELGEAGETKGKFSWMDLLKVMALPLVTLLLGFVFNKSLNERQASESNMRLYTEMMGRREQADSDLRKDMFKSILDTFMSKDPKLERKNQLRQEVLNLELLAYNFHESLDIGPLFKDVRSRIDQSDDPDAQLRNRLEKVAREVIERQLTAVSDSGMVESGETLPEKIDDLQAYVFFGAHTVPDPEFKPGEGVSRLCLSMTSTDEVRHYRQFKLEIIKNDPGSREVQVRLYVSQVLDQAECLRADLDLESNREIDTNFWVGLFDFPMIDNTRLTHGERCAVSLTTLTPSVLGVALAYFPGSRASLKERPYYDEVMHDLVRGHWLSEPSKH
jgi:hypothetical protein